MQEEGSVLIALQTVAETLRVCAPTVLESLWGGVTRERCNERLERWAQRVLEHTGIQLTVEGREHSEGEEPFVVLSNHASNYDIHVTFAAFGRPLRMVAKQELFRVPVLGAALEAGEFISIDRKNHERALASLERARARLDSGLSVWVAPEGTQTKDGALLPFKKGAFHLALAAGRRILPLSLEGTREVLPAGSWRVRRGQRVLARFHAPVDPRDYGREQIEALSDEVRRRIASGLSRA